MTGLSTREERIEIAIGEAVRMLGLGHQTEHIDYVDEADLQIRELLSQYRDGGERFHRRDVAGAGHHDIGLVAFVGAMPSPRCRCPSCNARSRHPC